MSAKTPYPDYKDSGVMWLGEIPSHWQIARIKNSVLSAKNGVWGDDPADGEEDIRCVRVADFNRQQMTIHDDSVTFRSVPLKDRVGRVLRKGDLLLEKSGGGPNTPVGFVVLYDRNEPAVCSNFVARVELRTGQDSSYWRYLHSTTYASGLTQRSIKQATGIQNLDQSSYFDEAAPFPPFDEQRAIARYLDHETAEIDAFIADQEELIALLNERRAATITQAVTKGLDLTVPMKDSGIDWLGKVPESWQVTRIKHVASTHIGLTYAPEDIVDENKGGTLVLRSGNVQEGEIDLSDCVYVSRTIPSSIRTRRGDILICARNGSRHLIGKNAVIGAESEGQTFGAFMSVLRSDLNPYLRWILNSTLFQAQMGLFVTATINQLTNATLNNFEIPLPPESERKEIIDYIEREVVELNAAIVDAKQAIKLSKERRAALISAAVTGKIDVRNHIIAELGAA